MGRRRRGRCLNISYVSQLMPQMEDGTKTDQFRQISKPPPSANPFTAAMMGLLPTRRLTPAKPVGGCSCVDGSLLWAPLPPPLRLFSSMRSWPAQKALFPAPVMMATRKLGSLSNHLKRLSASQWPNEGIEFIAWGRLMATTRMKGEGYERMNVGVGGGGVARGEMGLEGAILERGLD
jgi:hypothetical protein